MPYSPGQHKVICQRCGFTRLSGDCSREPKTGLFVCRDTCLDQRHPLDTPPQALGERQSVTNHFPENMDNVTFINPGDNKASDL